MSRHWENTKDAYTIEDRLVEDSTGRIMGWVSGSRFDDSGWYAATEVDGNGRKRIGEFTTRDMAKKAVENAGEK